MKKYSYEKVCDALATVENLKERIFDGNIVWAGETKSSMRLIEKILEDYLEIEIKDDK